MPQQPMLAPCGIACAECAIFLAARDPEKAERLAAEWRAAGHPKAEAAWFRCQGCRADRSLRWTEDCAIAQCCVEQRKLDLCSECPDLPCQRLEEWAAHGDHHRAALERLKQMALPADP